MHKASLWIGVLLCTIGLAVIATSAVMSYMGLNLSYNLGDPGKFEFILVPLWQIGLVIAGVGAVGVFGVPQNPKHHVKRAVRRVLADPETQRRLDRRCCLRASAWCKFPRSGDA